MATGGKWNGGFSEKTFAVRGTKISFRAPRCCKRGGPQGVESSFEKHRPADMQRISMEGRTFFSYFSPFPDE